MDIGPEIETLETIAGHYDVSKDFDLHNTMLATRIILPFCADKTVVEIGCATGEMTAELVKVANELTVIEPSRKYCDLVSEKLKKDGNESLRLVNAFLSDFAEDKKYDVIVLAGLLHHLEAPSDFLMDLKRLLHDESVVLATVPNMTSLHRRIGVRAGLLADMYDTTLRNDLFNQYGRFDLERFEGLFRLNGYNVRESYGYMLKPFNSSQMMSLYLAPPIIDALFDLGREFPELASQLFICAVLSEEDM